jgi:hypothetical protein
MTTLDTDAGHVETHLANETISAGNRILSVQNL